MSAESAASPLVTSSYDPNGQYLCYVTTALDKQRISVEPTQKSQNDISLNEKFLYLESSELRVSALKWAFLNSNETLCVFIGLNNGEIWLYSPLGNEIILKLSTENAYAINDLVISKDSLFCVDANDYIYEFDLINFTLRNHFKIEECSNLRKIEYLGENRIAVASHQIFLIDNAKKEIILILPGHISPVCTLKKLNDEFILSGAENDRFLNIYTITDGSIKSVLVAKSNIDKVSVHGTTKVAVTTENGNIEVFEDPLVSNKAKRRNVKSRQSTNAINIVNKSGAEVPCVNVYSGKDIVNITYLTNATACHFVQVRWGSLSVKHEITVDMTSNVKSTSQDRTLYGQDLAATGTYKEGNARVTSGDNFKHIEDIISEMQQELEEDRANEDDDSSNVQSLADKLPTLNISKKKSPVTGTVAVILSQALQSNDHSLLETVLNNRDERIIRDTIMRLKPSLSVVLLERLAERIARQTHRQGALNVWVKWCIIIHGGYLISVPNLIKTLASLHSTLKSRASLLDRLLLLEAKLNCSLNKFETTTVEGTDTANSANEEVIDDDEEVTYVEELDDANLMESGEEGMSSDEDDEEDSDIDEETIDERSQPHTNGKELKLVSADEEEGYSDVEMV